MSVFRFFKKAGKKVNEPNNNNVSGQVSSSGTISRFRLSMNPCTAEDYVFEGHITDSSAELSYFTESRSYDDNGNFTTEKEIEGEAKGGAELREAVLALIDECGVRSWDGFHGFESGVLDGESMNFEAELDDGSVISASGNNSFPKGYQKFCSGLHRLVNSR